MENKKDIREVFKEWVEGIEKNLAPVVEKEEIKFNNSIYLVTTENFDYYNEPYYVFSDKNKAFTSLKEANKYKKKLQKEYQIQHNIRRNNNCHICDCKKFDCKDFTKDEYYIEDICSYSYKDHYEISLKVRVKEIELIDGDLCITE